MHLDTIEVRNNAQCTQCKITVHLPLEAKPPGMFAASVASAVHCSWRPSVSADVRPLFLIVPRHTRHHVLLRLLLRIPPQEGPRSGPCATEDTSGSGRSGTRYMPAGGPLSFEAAMGGGAGCSGSSGDGGSGSSSNGAGSSGNGAGSSIRAHLSLGDESVVEEKTAAGAGGVDSQANAGGTVAMTKFGMQQVAGGGAQSTAPIAIPARG